MLRYDFDTCVGEINLPANESFLVRLNLRDQDMVGFALDGKPKTVAALQGGKLHDYEDQDPASTVNRVGGLDHNHGTRANFDLGIDTKGPILQSVEVK